MRSNQITWIVIGVFLGQTCAPFTLAWADDYQDSYCDAFCGMLVDPSTGQARGLGTGPYSAQDASTCASYNANKAGSPLPNPLPSPWPNTQQGQFVCQYHDGQALQHCQAYEASGQASGAEKVLVPLDLAAAGVCMTACVLPGAHAGLEKVCDYAATAAGAAEAIQTFAMKSSAVGKAVNSALAAAGIIGGLGGQGLLGGTLDGAVNSVGTKVATQFGMNTAAETTSATQGLSLTNTPQTFEGVPVTQKPLLGPNSYGPTGQQPTKPNSHRGLACAESALMIIMATLRMKNFGSAQETKKDACNAIKSLESSSSLAASVGLAPALGGLSGNSGSSTMAGNNGALGSGAAPSNPVACAQNGLGNQPGGCGLTGQQLAATDASGLNSGLGQAVAADAGKIDTAGLMNQLQSGADPGSLVGQGIGGQGGAFGQQLAKLARATSLHAQELGAAGGHAGGLVMGGGSTPQGASSDSGFHFNFGQSSFNTAAKQMTFAPVPKTYQPGDIWHTGYKGTIFQIVSNKIKASMNQVAHLQWASPLNRAIAGLPAYPANSPRSQP